MPSWDATVSRQSFGWVPLSRRTDLWNGVDFIPKVSNEAPFKLDSTRPIALWELSVITASNFSYEGRP